MHNWDDLKYCLALKRYGTMSGAANALKTNVATVSRRIHGLSEELGAPLFTKEGQKWKPTSFANALADLANQTEEVLQKLETENNDDTAPRELRINCDSVIRQSRVMGAVASLFETIPNVVFTLRFGTASLGFGETDVFITTTQFGEGNLIQRRVGAVKTAVWCGAAYQHSLQSWIRLENCPPLDPQQEELAAVMGPEQMVLNDGMLCAEVIQKLPFAATLTEDFAVRQRGLRLLTQFEPVSHPVWAYFHGTRRNDSVVQLAIEWVSTAFKMQNEQLVIPANVTLPYPETTDS